MKCRGLGLLETELALPAEMCLAEHRSGEKGGSTTAGATGRTLDSVLTSTWELTTVHDLHEFSTACHRAQSKPSKERAAARLTKSQGCSVVQLEK